MPYKRKSAVVDQAVLHPDKELQRLLGRASNHFDSAKADMVARRLQILHEICQKYHEEGGLDFSSGVIGKRFIDAVTVDRSAVHRKPYRELILAWATFAGGQTLHPKWLRSQQVRTETIDYIRGYFSKHELLPTWATIHKEGMEKFNSVPRSETARTKHIKYCIIEWEKSQLQNVPAETVLICDQIFKDSGSVPVGNEPQFTDSLLAKPEAEKTREQIEFWRSTRFALEVWRFSATREGSNFQWLALHPDLLKWLPYVTEFLEARVAKSLLRTSKFALTIFFVDYLILNKLPCGPEEFLDITHKPVSFLEVCFLGKSINEIAKKRRAVYDFIDLVLERREGFFEIDNHGHLVRSLKYGNPFLAAEINASEWPEPRRKTRLRAGSLQDPQLNILTSQNPKLEPWRVYALEWLSSVKVSLGVAQKAITLLLLDYIVAERLPSDPTTIFSREWQANNPLPSYRDTALKNQNSKHAATYLDKAVEFLDFILEGHYAAEDDYGRRIVSGDFCNFLSRQAKELPRTHTWQYTHSNKDVLPSRYIRYLRDLICPLGARYFSDLTWSSSALPAGDWFEVSSSAIDTSDPDCVWRLREVAGKKGHRTLKRKVYEIWSPARTIALLVKLELPLRTHQVRLLDSGEADTWRYGGSSQDVDSTGNVVYRPGQFSKNLGPLVSDLAKHERHSGVFRRMYDAMTGSVFTGLYINTNKTRDQGKAYADRGYVVPWQHPKVLYWTERLRNWQEKYNPISSLVSCMVLPEKILGDKTPAQKSQMGEMAFLFRDGAGQVNERSWPVTDSKVSFLWERALRELENICALKGHRAADGSLLRFVYEDKMETKAYSAFFPLHSLRVSLITHFATEGGVEMHILSECIAGHARILMTLYYKKSGIVYVSEAMDAASVKLRNETVEQDNWIRWIKEASLSQLEVNSVSVDVSVLEVVHRAIDLGGVSLLRTNLGLCAKGGMACGTGGTEIDEDSGTKTHGPVPGYPQKNCVRCRWFLSGPAFLHALVHHWNLLHFNLGDNGGRYLQLSEAIAKLESEMLDCQEAGTTFQNAAKLEHLRHGLTSIYDGNEKLAADSLATMKLIVRCKHIIDKAQQVDSGVLLVSVGGMEEVTINVRECGELEQIMTAAVGSTIYVDDDAEKAVLKAGNAFDRMLLMNEMEPCFFKLDAAELPIVVQQMTTLLQTYAGDIARAVPFVEGLTMLSTLGLYGSTEDILDLVSPGIQFKLPTADKGLHFSSVAPRKIIPIKVATANNIGGA